MWQKGQREARKDDTPSVGTLLVCIRLAVVVAEPVGEVSVAGYNTKLVECQPGSPETAGSDGSPRCNQSYSDRTAAAAAVGLVVVAAFAAVGIVVVVVAAAAERERRRTVH